MGLISVHVWTVFLRPEEAALASLAKLLSQDERDRANRFHFEKDRVAYIAAHGGLRRILAAYFTCDPEDVCFRDGPNGKPAVDGIQFNLSHSADLAVVAVTEDRELGVDVERVDPSRADQNVAERFFSPYEVSLLRTLPPGQQTEAFFNCWTRKEAYLKAIGLGLSVPLDSFDVTLVPGEPARLLRGVEAKWRLRSFVPAPGYIGALVVDAAQDDIETVLKSAETLV